MNIRRELKIIHEELINAQQKHYVDQKMMDAWSMAIEMILYAMEEEE